MYRRSLETSERVGDAHGMAQAWGNLGIVYKDKGEWDRAIEMHRRSLQVTEKIGDVLTSANQYANLGIIYLQTQQMKKAKPLFARAYLIFSQIGSPDTDTAFQGLIQACGSPKAAKAYLADFQQKTELKGT
jgi:Tfp pilus assembly protein PilF